MTTQSPDLAFDVAAISARLLEIPEPSARARTIADVVAGSLPGAAVNIYLLASGAVGDVWNVCATVGDAAPDPSIPLQTGHLSVLSDEGKPLLLAGKQLVREEYAHLNVRRTLRSLAYLPLLAGDSLIGAMEVLRLPLPRVSASAVTSLCFGGRHINS